MKITVEVPYRDVDAMGHLNNVVYLSYLEWARQKYWLKMKGSANYRDIDFIVARAEIDYRSQVRMGERLEVEVHVARIGNSSFDFQYRVTGPDGRLVAEAKTVQVLFDWDENRTKRFTDVLRKQIEEFEQSEVGSPKS
jgi:acyl-CoA thioester hydrolase